MLPAAAVPPIAPQGARRPSQDLGLLPQPQLPPSKQQVFQYKSWLKAGYEEAQANHTITSWTKFSAVALFLGIGDLFANIARFIVNTAHQIKVFLIGEMPSVSKHSFSPMKLPPPVEKSRPSAAAEPEQRAPNTPPADKPLEERTLSDNFVRTVTSTNDHVGKIGEGLRESVKNSPGLGSSFCFASGVIVSALFSPELATAAGLAFAISTSVRYFRSHSSSRAPEAAS